MSIYYHISLIVVELIMLACGYCIGKYGQKLKFCKRSDKLLDTIRKAPDVDGRFAYGFAWAIKIIYFGEKIPYLKDGEEIGKEN